MDVAATLLTCDGLFTEVSGFGNQCNSLGNQCNSLLDRSLVMSHTPLGRMQEVCGLLVYAPTNMHISSP